jgi:hypothetical protein
MCFEILDSNFFYFDLYMAKIKKYLLLFLPLSKLNTCYKYTGRKIYCECHFLLSITDKYCHCTVSADNYCQLLSLLLSVLRITVVYCAFYCQCCDLLLFTVLVLSLLRITVIYCPYRSPRASPGIAPLADYTQGKLPFLKNSFFQNHFFFFGFSRQLQRYQTLHVYFRKDLY